MSKTGGDATFEIQASNTLFNAETEEHPQSTTTIFEGPICDELSTTREDYLPNERTMPITNLCKKRKVEMKTNTRSEKHLKKRSSTKKRYKTNTHSSTQYGPLNTNVLRQVQPRPGTVSYNLDSELY